MNPNPYESPTTVSRPQQNRPADARAMGKVLAVVLGLFVSALIVLAMFGVYSLWWISISAE